MFSCSVDIYIIIHVSFPLSLSGQELDPTGKERRKESELVGDNGSGSRFRFK